ncbi:MAG: YmfQ family protein [Methylophilaceae bacterium]
MALSADDYYGLLQGLLPKGPAWPREAGILLNHQLYAWAEELSKIDARIDDLLDEADPRNTNELLVDWERVVGLPDRCVTIAQTYQQRIDALVSKLQTLGGQSRAYFIALADSLGYTNTTIEEYQPFLCGENTCGDALWSEPDRFVWQLNLPSDGSITYFECGESACGDALQSWGDEVLECRINQYKPAHTTAIFAYV